MSDEKSKGISLRTKRKGRPAISAPKQISGPIPQTSNPLRSDRPLDIAPPQQRPQLGGATSDLVKRRYSTRFNNLPSDFDATAPPVPNLPSLPAQYGRDAARARGPSPARGPGLAVDINALRNPDLQHEQYVAAFLTDASEQDISDYQQALRRMRNRTSTDLQQNVYQNRTQFIKISKEAEKLKGEMRALRNLMSELKTNTIALRAASSNGVFDTSGFDESYVPALSKRDKRSSVADRTAMWNSQLQALWKSVEGSQKSLPAVPGRHVVQNAGIWIELDNATWKSRRAMQIILLNDHLLVASRKKRKIEGSGIMDAKQPPSKLVADRCWPLIDIEMVDLAGSIENASSRNRVANAIMIRGVGQESFTYRTEKAEDNEKASLLINFRKAVEELRKGLRSDIDSSNRDRDTINYFTSRDSGLLHKSDLMKSISDIRKRPDTLVEVDGKQQNLRWVESQFDDLDVDIALQRCDAAVDRVEKLNGIARGLKNNLMAQDFILYRAEERATRLAGMITRELVDGHNELKKTMRNVTWLARLGFEDRAREAYLEARAQIIQKRSRSVHIFWEYCSTLAILTAIPDSAFSAEICFATFGKSLLSILS